jgi:hypothetical protein
VRDYDEFIRSRMHYDHGDGFDVADEDVNPMLFDFQRALVKWACEKGRAAIFADCGLGKTPMQLEWARLVCERSGGRVLILTPLAVGPQTVREAEKFGVEASRSHDGKPAGRITVTNYERLHLFDKNDYVGVVADESSILKNFDGSTKAAVTEFMRTLRYRLLCTATAAPNDYVELGTSSEALGVMGHMDMLTCFFRNQQGNAVDTGGKWRGHAAPRVFEQPNWRFKRHAEQEFWRWVVSWARAIRRPSDLGFEDDGFNLPPITERETVIGASRPLEGRLFVQVAQGLAEQRQERRATIEERCEAVAVKVDHGQPAVCWCHLNAEGDLLERLIPDAVQVSGSDSDEEKEERLTAFAHGEIRVLVTKPRIGGFGLNWQHCAHVTVFPSHSYEQYYQAVRRCWRFGQKRPVVVDIVTTEGELGVLENLQRKASAADRMFTELVRHMNDELRMDHANPFTCEEMVPAWL